MTLLTRDALVEAMAGPDAIGITLPPETALVVADEALTALERLLEEHGLKVLPEDLGLDESDGYWIAWSAASPWPWRE